MKKTFFVCSLLALGAMACNEPINNSGQAAEGNTLIGSGTNFSKPVDIDTANRMIQSYLDGINYTVNNDEIRSLIYDADVLRDYINDTSNGVIKKVKFIFAHSLDYIHSGHEGQRPDTNSNALTLIIVGIDAQSNYVYTINNQVLDFCQPCPKECPDRGSAANDLLVPPQP